MNNRGKNAPSLARKPTSFERRVYAAVRKIPSGYVVTYAELARAIGCRSPRAVGQALRRNPWAPQVPCHRVIGADGRPGGFQGARSGKALAVKIARLAAEGVIFRHGRLRDKERRLIWVSGHFRPAAARCRRTS